MGLYGAIIVLPNDRARPRCTTPARFAANLYGVRRHWGEKDFRLSHAAYDHAEDLLRPRISVPVLGDGSEHSHAGAGAGRGSGQLHGRRCGLQPERPDRALPPGVFHDQRALDARRHGPELRDPVSAPALQRQSAHASGRAGAAADHRPGPLAASVPRARQPRAHPGARRQPDSQRRPIANQLGRTAAVHHDHDARAWRWTESSTGPARA